MSHIIAGCQFEPEIGAIEANCTTIRELATGLSDDVRLAVFPELCLTGYDLDVAVDTATPVPGPITDRLTDIAADANLILVVGLSERDGEVIYNDLVCVSADGVESRYRKQYLWGDEADVFEAGKALSTVETPVGTLGFLLCYDLNFPEAALVYGQRGVDILAVSAAWRESYRPDWDLLLRARALDTTCYVVGTNHAGDQKGRRHNGGSLVAGPDGDVLDRTADGFASVGAVFDSETLSAAKERNPVSETRTKDTL